MATIQRSLTGRIVVRLDDDEKTVLRSLVEQVLDMVQPDAPMSADPIEQLLGSLTNDVERPSDPALIRLFPDAYLDDDGASADFRKFTQDSLRELKSANALTMLATLERSGTKLTLSSAEAMAWLGSLNDMRLTIGVRIGVTEENHEELLDDANPNSMMAQVYTWLTYLQESLITAIA